MHNFHSQAYVEGHGFLRSARLGRRTNIALIVVLQYTRLFNDLNFARFVRLGFLVYVDSLLILRFNWLVFSERWLWIAYRLRWLFVIGINISRRIYIWSVEFIHRLRFVYRSRSLVDYRCLLWRSVIVVHLAELIKVRVDIRLLVTIIIRRLLASVRVLVGLNRLPVIVLITVLVCRIILVVASSIITVILSLLLFQRWLWCVNLSSFLSEILLSTFLFLTLFGYLHLFLFEFLHL